MLNIHERKQCGVPVVIQGETGVGKTALIELLSKLWNVSYKAWIDREKYKRKTPKVCFTSWNIRIEPASETSMFTVL